MSSSLASLISNAQRLSQRLKNRESDVDRILAGAEEVNNQLETMRQVCSNDQMNDIVHSNTATHAFRILIVIFVSHH